MRTWVGLSALIAGGSLALAQQYVISTIAGGGPRANAPALTTSIAPFGVATDTRGNIYIADSANSRVWKLSQGGILSAVAGNGRPGYSGDGGPATSAQLNEALLGVAVDASGNLYIAESNNAAGPAPRVRKVSANGIITTVAGNGTFGVSGDGGPATSAQLGYLTGVAVDGAGNLYIGDSSNPRVRKVSANGIITTVAGNGTEGYSGDGGPAISAQLSTVAGVAVDAAGNLYIADNYVPYPFTSFSPRVRKVSANGIITTVAGNGTQGYSGDGGPATSAQLSYANGVAVDGAGNIYIADGDLSFDCFTSRVRKVSATGGITTVAGIGAAGYSGDGGPATSAALNCVQGLAADGAGNLYLADLYNYRLRMVAANGIITTIAGNGTGRGYSGDGGPATSARLGGTLRDVTLDAFGSMYITDSDDNRILKVSPKGIVTAFAGNSPYQDYSGDGGPAASAALSWPDDVAVDSAGNVYIADTVNGRVRKVSTTGIISTVAGGGRFGYLGDGGPATAAGLSYPVGVAVDAAGNVYIADQLKPRIRKVSLDGIITTIAGTGTEGDSGDGGPATNAQITAPYAPAVDGAGNLYFADYKTHRIRRISTSGIITTVAGNGNSGYSGDGGPATAAQLYNPAGLALDSAGNLYIADYGNARVRKVSPNGIISTIAGNGGWSSSGDGGLALNASFSAVGGLAVDRAGNVYVADSSSTAGVIRLLEPDGPPPTITAVTNAASNLQGPIAPGEIVVLSHSGIGPAQLTPFRLNDAGLVDTQLDRTQVTFNGIPAPLVYSWTSNVSAVVPYSVSGTSAQVQLTFRGLTSAPFTVQVAPSSPGLFTADSTGRGQAAARNQQGTFNSTGNPEKIGGLINLYATGEGQTSPAGIDGKLGDETLPTPVLPVTVTIGGQPAIVLEKGGTPGTIAGVLWIIATIPNGITPGDAVPVTVQVGNASSQSGVTIAVR